MSETALYHQIGLLQQELSWCKQALEHTSSERNKYRSQALMRANKIEELQNELQEIYTKESN
jgi:hypothetical protein